MFHLKSPVDRSTTLLTLNTTTTPCMTNSYHIENTVSNGTNIVSGTCSQLVELPDTKKQTCVHPITSIFIFKFRHIT